MDCECSPAILEANVALSQWTRAVELDWCRERFLRKIGFQKWRVSFM